MGVFFDLSNYFELETTSGALKFHFGDSSLGWGTDNVAVSGGGVANGQQIFSPSWVNLSKNPWIPIGGGEKYGILWRERTFTNYNNDDLFYAWDSGGQFIFIFPQWSLVIVATCKWNVGDVQAGINANAVFELVNDHILPSISP